MSDLASLNIAIKTSGHQQAIGNIDQVKDAGVRAQGSFQSLQNMRFDSLISSVQRLAVAIGGLYLLEKVMSSWYGLIKGGVLAVDDLQKKIVGTSYILSTMSEVKPVDLGKAYGAWKDYFDWLYKQSLEADKKSAASAQDIFGVSVELAKKGVVAATKEEMETIGRLTDLMKAVTPAYASLEQQARGEIEAMLSGTMRMGAQTAIILGQIDPAFKKNIESAREQGTVLEYIRKILPDIKQYTLDLMGTWDAVSASLKSAWNVVQIKAFGDAHRDVVAFAQQLGDKLVNNGALTADGIKLADALGMAWSEAKVQVAKLIDYILNNMPEVISNVKATASAMGSIASGAAWAARELVSVVTQMRELASNPLAMAVAGGLLGSRFGAIGAAVGAVGGLVAGTAISTQGAINQTQGKVAEVSKQKTALEKANQDLMGQYGISQNLLAGAGGASGNAPPVPKVKPFTPKEGKGGGGGDGGAYAEAGRLASLFDSLTKDISRLSEGKLSEIEANYVKTVDQIYKKTEVRAVSEAELVVLAKQRETLQKTKAEEEYGLFVAKKSGDQYAELSAQATKWTQDYKGFKDSEKNIAEMVARQKTIIEANRITEVTNLEKTYVDAMASASPLFEDQVKFKKQSLDLENKLAEAAITKLMAEKPYLKYLEDELRARQANTNQLKAYNLELESNKGIQGWAAARVKSDQQKNNWSDFMSGAESFITDAWTQGIQGALGKTKMDFMEIAKTMGTSLLLNLGKWGITKGFGAFAELINGKGPDKIGTKSNPMHVTFDGAEGILKGSKADTASFDRSITKADKTGMSLGGSWGGSSDLGGYAKLMNQAKQYDKLDDSQFKEERKETKILEKENQKMYKLLFKGENTYQDMIKERMDLNQESFSDEYINGYEGTFTGMATNITSVWGLAQGIMTMAGVSGETARYGTMVTYGMQGIAFIMKLAKASILVDAYRGAAAAYAWVMKVLPFPINTPAAIAAAALTFAGISAYGAMGGTTSGIATAHDGMLVAHTGMLVAHNGALLADERIIKAQVGEGIIKRDTMSAYARRGISFDMLNNGQVGGGSVDNSSINIGKGAVTVQINNPSKDFDANKLVKKIVPALQKQIKLNRLRIA